MTHSTFDCAVATSYGIPHVIRSLLWGSCNVGPSCGGWSNYPGHEPVWGQRYHSRADGRGSTMHGHEARILDDRVCAAVEGSTSADYRRPCATHTAVATTSSISRQTPARASGTARGWWVGPLTG